MVGEFRIKKRVNGINYYGSIELDVSINDQGQLNVIYDDLGVEHEWVTSINFGIDVFYKYYLLERNGGLDIYVKKLHAMIGDTTPAIVFYIVVKCLSEMYMQSEEIVSFNEENGKFELIK